MFLFDWKLWLGVLFCYAVGALPFPKILRHVWASLKFEGEVSTKDGNLIVITEPREKYLTGLAQIAKGLLPILLMQWLTGRADFIFWGGLALVIGHLSSPILKQEHTQTLLIAMGVLLRVDPVLLLWGVILTGAVFYFTRELKQGVLAAIVFMFLYAYLLGYPFSVVLFLFFYGFIQWNLSSHGLYSRPV